MKKHYILFLIFTLLFITGCSTGRKNFALSNRQNASQILCPYCNAVIDAGDKFCDNCGKQIDIAVRQVKTENIIPVEKNILSEIPTENKKPYIQPGYEIRDNKFHTSKTTAIPGKKGDVLSSPGSRNSGTNKNNINPEVLYKQARSLMIYKEFLKAEILIKKAMLSSPKNPKYISLLGDIYVNSGRIEAAIEAYNEALRLLQAGEVK